MRASVYLLDHTHGTPCEIRTSMATAASLLKRLAALEAHVDGISNGSSLSEEVDHLELLVQDKHGQLREILQSGSRHYTISIVHGSHP
jgi:ribonucleotide monophosphatase NagD (HAD superfamily)